MIVITWSNLIDIAIGITGFLISAYIIYTFIKVRKVMRTKR